MCKQNGNDFCSELGDDVSSWSKVTPLPKPKWISDSLSAFKNAINLAVEGKVIEAQSLLKDSRDLEMRAWFDIHAQNVGLWRSKAINVETPNARVQLDTLKTFGKFEEELFARDNYCCRYCASEVFPKKLFKRVQSVVGETFLPLGRTNKTRSGFYLLAVATLDHVLPWSLGGRTNPNNLVTSCWSCNYGKANFTIEQIGILNPFDNEPM